jgi:hypothetical protein
VPRFSEREPDVLGREEEHERDEHRQCGDVQDADSNPAGGNDGEDDQGLNPVGDE